ncbi:MAG: hypothetical protein GX221_00250 [Candidatus Riflebacteria bacterium]|nr:hypothetical protein [Candidatus Riflebacteria bacterium]
MSLNKLISFRLVLLAFLALGLAFASIQEAAALSAASSATLQAFRRYEKTFLQAESELRKLQQDLTAALTAGDASTTQELLGKASQKMQLLARGYSDMENLYYSTLASNKPDGSQLHAGFMKIYDAYHKAFMFHKHNIESLPEQFAANQHKTEEKLAALPSATQLPKKQAELPVALSETKELVETGDYEGASYTPSELELQIDTLLKSLSSKRASFTETATAKGAALKIKGSLMLKYSEIKETITEQNTVVPVVTAKSTLYDKLSQAKLFAVYNFNSGSFTLQEDYQARQRNEKIHEHFLTLAYNKKMTSNVTLVLRDKLRLADYPDETYKNFKDNTAEIVLDNQRGNNNFSYSAGLVNRRYKDISYSDFDQILMNFQQSSYNEGKTFYLDYAGELTSYKSFSDLDYDSHSLYAEYSSDFTGNNSTLQFSDSFMYFNYISPDLIFYRDDYIDNTARVSYSLPINSKADYTIETIHNKRKYDKDHLRGYQELDFFNQVIYEFSPKERVTLSFRYIDNDENIKKMSHENYVYTGSYRRRLSEQVIFNFDKIYRKRDGNNSIVGKTMDFDENQYNTAITVKARQHWMFSLKNVYLERLYDLPWYPDYRYNHFSAEARYMPPGNEMFTIAVGNRHFSFRNYNQARKPWETRHQPVGEMIYTKRLKKDLDFNLTLSYEKTWQQTYDIVTQELLYDFSKPRTDREIVLSLNLDF